MGIDYFAAASNTVTDLSIRAIVGTAAILILLLMLTSIFRKNNRVKLTLFALIIAIIVLVTIILLATALDNIQQPIASALMGGAI
jgi:hypothetical protein